MEGKLYRSTDPKPWPEKGTVSRPVVLIPERNLALYVNPFEANRDLHSGVAQATGGAPGSHLMFVRDVEVPDDLINDALELQEKMKEYNMKSRSFLKPLEQEVQCECRAHS